LVGLVGIGSNEQALLDLNPAKKKEQVMKEQAMAQELSKKQANEKQELENRLRNGQITQEQYATEIASMNQRHEQEKQALVSQINGDRQHVLNNLKNDPNSIKPPYAPGGGSTGNPAGGGYTLPPVGSLPQSGTGAQGGTTGASGGLTGAVGGAAGGLGGATGAVGGLTGAVGGATGGLGAIGGAGGLLNGIVGSGQVRQTLMGHMESDMNHAIEG
jgi:hypothetical protein